MRPDCLPDACDDVPGWLSDSPVVKQNQPGGDAEGDPLNNPFQALADPLVVNGDTIILAGFYNSVGGSGDSGTRGVPRMGSPLAG